MSVTPINEIVIQIMDATQFAHGDVVEQQHTLSATEDLHESVLAFWRPTWGALETVDADTWQRVISFFQAYVPRFNFELSQSVCGNGSGLYAATKRLLHEVLMGFHMLNCRRSQMFGRKDCLTFCMTLNRTTPLGPQRFFLEWPVSLPKMLLHQLLTDLDPL